jgi:hypothetical protein
MSAPDEPKLTFSADEVGTPDALKAHRRKVLDPAIAAHT